jgi:hypothetical protein
LFDWLFEGRTNVYVMLAALALFLLLVWWQMRRRWLLMGVPIVLALIGLYALLDKWVETDREQIVRKVQEMAAAVNARDLDKLLAHISDHFRSPQGRDKQQLREEIAHYLQAGIVSNARVWDIVCEDRPSREQGTVRVLFSAKADTGGGPPMADCVADFDFDPTHGWRMRSLELFQPQSTERWQIQL